MTIEDFEHLSVRHRARVQRLVDEAARLKRWDEFTRRYNLLAPNVRHGSRADLRIRLGIEMDMTESETRLALWGR